MKAKMMTTISTFNSDEIPDELKICNEDEMHIFRCGHYNERTKRICNKIIGKAKIQSGTMVQFKCKWCGNYTTFKKN